MSKTGPIGEPSFQPTEGPKTGQTGPTGPISGDEGGGGTMGAALSTPVHSLGELKELLIANLGKEKGTKFYNMVLKTIGMMMLSQVQGASEQARKAAHEMRMKR